ncbi:MAG: hypothetical protein II661_03150, partial [Bacteroidales bacterium]|nr:hypothetical protein [Bacteroidales bacterium]
CPPHHLRRRDEQAAGEEVGTWGNVYPWGLLLVDGLFLSRQDGLLLHIGNLWCKKQSFILEFFVYLQMER